MTIVTENQLFTEEIPEKGATKGQVRFSLKSRKPDDIALAGFCANIAASLLFERMQAQGTNMIIDLSDSSRIDVLARYEDDGLNLLWTPKPAEPSTLDSAQERIRNKTFFIGKEREEKKENKEDRKEEREEKEGKGERKEERTQSKETGGKKEERIPQAAPSAEDMLSEEEEDYLIKQLHRIP
jgi:hypothetical protein